MQEATTTAMVRLYQEDPDMFVWWGTEVECVSAITRVERERDITTTLIAELLKRLDELAAGWYEIQPVVELKSLARRLLRVHPLRAADALQLAAACLAAEKNPATLPFVCLDHRLSEAARKEGFAVRSA